MKHLFVALLALAAAGAVVAEPDCTKLAEAVCVAPNETRVVDGSKVFRECWQYQTKYRCRSSTTVSNCAPLLDRGCTQTNASCIEKAPDASCALWEQRYQCPDKPPVTIEKTVCDTSFCQDKAAGCFDTSHPADKDFGQAAAMMEVQREAGVYGVDADKVEIFKGFMEECSLKVLGGSKIKSCCAPDSGGAQYSNYNVIGVTAKAAYAVGKEELKAGSKFVYDSLFQAQDASLIQNGMGAAAGGLSEGAAEGVAAQAGTNFGAYGFEFSYSAAGGFEFVSFDPYSFAISIAIAVITEWLSCDPAERVMALKRGQNLCVHIDTYCSSKVLGVCVEKKERHCCFNSMLAKLVNRQGRAQLGLPMNQCGGFTEVQIKAIDFAKVDLTEFIATIVPKDVPVGDAQTEVSNTVNQKVIDYYGPGPY